MIDQVGTAAADKHAEADAKLATKARQMFFESELPQLIQVRVPVGGPRQSGAAPRLRIESRIDERRPRALRACHLLHFAPSRHVHCALVGFRLFHRGRLGLEILTQSSSWYTPVTSIELVAE